MGKLREIIFLYPYGNARGPGKLVSVGFLWVPVWPLRWCKGPGWGHSAVSILTG